MIVQCNAVLNSAYSERWLKFYFVDSTESNWVKIRCRTTWWFIRRSAVTDAARYNGSTLRDLVGYDSLASNPNAID